MSSERIQQASPQDLLQLQHLMDEANQYALTLSKRLTWENIEKAKKAIEQQIHLGQVFVIRADNGKISSSITLSEVSDEWGDFGSDGKALYFAKFMKDPVVVGSEGTLNLLRFAAKEAEKRNKSYLRCDAVSDHLGLISYYKKLGFREKGRFVYTTGREGTLLEVSIAELSL